MASPDNKFEELARDAVANVQAARDAGQQLTFLPDEAQPGDADRAKRGRGKATSQLRDFLAARGLRLPEDVLVEMAGMASSDDAFVTAMARAEQVLAWGQIGATGFKGAPTQPSLGQRLAVFQFVFTAQLRAAEALLPYGLGKVTPDVQVSQAVQIVMPGAQAPSRGPDTARDVTPKPSNLAPPAMPWEMQQNQDVSGLASVNSDVKNRTE